MAIKRKLFQFDEQYNPNQDLGFGRDDEFVDNILSDNLNTGGGGTKVSIIKGCMDTSAINYNPSATTPNNSVCKYDTPKDTPNATILLSTTSNRNAFDILFNSKNTINC